MSDVARQLRWLQSSLSASRSGSGKSPSGVIAGAARCIAARWIALGIAAALAIAAIGGLIGAALMSAEPRQRPRRRCGSHAYLLPPEGNYLTGGLALSPDGARARVRGRRCERRPADLDSRARYGARATVAGTSGASDPFWSPAGDEVAFFANNQLKRIASRRRLGRGDLRRRRRRRRLVEPRRHHRVSAASAGRTDACRGHGRTPGAGDDARRRRRRRRIICIRRFCPTAGTSSSMSPASSAACTSARLGLEGTRRFSSIPIRRCRRVRRPHLASIRASGHLLYVRDRVLMARPFDASSRSVRRAKRSSSWTRLTTIHRARRRLRCLVRFWSIAHVRTCLLRRCHGWIAPANRWRTSLRRRGVFASSRSIRRDGG